MLGLALGLGLGLGFDPSTPIVRELVLSLTQLFFPLVRFGPTRYPERNDDNHHLSKGIEMIIIIISSSKLPGYMALHIQNGGK